MEFLKQITVVSASFLAVLAVVTALSILFTLYRLTRHRPRRLLWLNAAVSVFLTLVLVADGVNAHYSYLPNIEDVVDAVTSTPRRRPSRCSGTQPTPISVMARSSAFPFPTTRPG